jgi:nucleoside-diphosphate-sugar epimerase
MDSDRATTIRRILVTGSAGAIGRTVASALARRGHFVRGFDLGASTGVTEARIGNLSDPEAVSAAAEGIDTVLHLAAQPDDADFLTCLLEPNVIGLYNVFASAKNHGVKRLVVASSCQVILGHEKRDEPITLDDGVAPQNHYALTKLWAEDMGEMYSRLYGLEVIAVRIGGFPRTPQELERIEGSGFQGLVLTHDDAVRFFTLAIETDPLPVPFAVLAATSRWPHPYMDLEPARRIIGYEPQDTYPDGIHFS